MRVQCPTRLYYYRQGNPKLGLHILVQSYLPESQYNKSARISFKDNMSWWTEEETWPITVEKR